MKEKNLEKLINELEKENELQDNEKVDEVTKEILRKMANGEINPEEATEIFLEQKKKL